MQVVGDDQHVLDGAAEPVELPDDERVTGPQVVERGHEARAVRGGLPGADLLIVDPGAPGGGQRVALELGVLAVGGDAGQADEVPVAAGKIENR